jgi:glycosyltransferase involved in cell wall biosynthesis
VDRLAEAIASLADNPAERAALGRAGRELIEGRFSDEIVARETLALYRAALAERGRFPALPEKPGKKSMPRAKSAE